MEEDNDIDIEEHDVLEDPRLRNIFPDLSQIKLEPQDFEDASMDCASYSDYDESSMHRQDTESEEYARYGNKIILGSKPSTSEQKVSSSHKLQAVSTTFGINTKVKEEIEDNDDAARKKQDLTDMYVNAIDSLERPSTVRIIGSKPSATGYIEPLNPKYLKQTHLETNKWSDKESNALGEKSVETPDVDLHEEQSKSNAMDNNDDNITTKDVVEDIEYEIKDSTVVLKDWGPILNASPCYCQTCEILFPTTNTLHAHNTAAHSLLVVVERNKAMKSTAKINVPKNVGGSEICRHCNKSFANNDLLLRHLYEDVLTPNNQIQPNVVKSDNLERKQISTNSDSKIKLTPSDTHLALKYKCMECHEVLLYHQRVKHRRKNHPNFTGSSLFIRLNTTPSTPIKTPNATPVKLPNIVSKSGNIATSSSNQATKRNLDWNPKIESPTERNPEITSSHAFVPLGVLFKCHKCNLHFTTYMSAVQHAKTCQGELVNNIWTCEICNLQFKTFANVMHKLQHKYSNKFKVYTCLDNAFKVLNECPDCHIYFTENDFFRHTKSKEVCRKESMCCEMCKINIHPPNYMNHKVLHSKTIGQIPDMILIKFAKTSDVKVDTGPVKRVLEIKKSNVPAKKAKLERPNAESPSTTSQFYVYYCSTCGTFLFNPQNREFHLAGRCEESKTMRVVCKSCGLTCFSSHVNKKACGSFASILDMKFRDVKDNNIIAPPIPEYFECKTCSVQFCVRKSVVHHDCEDHHKTCSLCHKKYSDSAYKLHKKFHEYHFQFSRNLIQPTSSGVTSNLIGSTKAQENRKALSPMSEILKKYEELSDTWNILFSCEDCELVCDDYEQVVEHCQKHFNNMESYDVIVGKCNICDLLFDNKCLQRHQALHIQNKSISKNSFKVLQYNYSNLYKPNFEDKIFKGISSAQAEQILSKSIYNSSIRSMKTVKMRVVQEGDPRTVMFICAKCNKVVHPNSVPTHHISAKCTESVNNTEFKQRWEQQEFHCRICSKMMNTYVTRQYHEKLHEIGNNFKIVYFNEEGDDEFNKKLFEKAQLFNVIGRDIFYLYKCVKCHFGSSDKDRVRTLKRHRCYTKPVKWCRICKVNLHKRVSKRHENMHKLYRDGQFKITTFVPMTVTNEIRKGSMVVKQFLGSRTPVLNKNIVQLYKCLCGLHFTKIEGAKKHFKICETGTNIDKGNCSKCGLLFDTTELFNHLCKDHGRKHGTEIEFKITELNGASQPIAAMNAHNVLHSANQRHLLYKCVRCNLHFLSKLTLLKHEQNHLKPMKRRLNLITGPCPYCKLKFVRQSLEKHISFHHKNLKLKRKDFNFVTLKDIRGKVAHNIASHVPSTSLRDNILYKCEECDNHFITLSNCKKHKYRCDHSNATSKHNRSQICSVCHYKMSAKTLKKHMIMHHNLMKLKREDIVIKKFKSNSSEDFQDSVKTDSPRAYAKKSTTKNMTYDETVPKVTSNDEDELESDIAEEEEDSIKISSENQQEKNTYKFCNIIFKCGLCGLHYFTDTTIHYHIKEVHVNKEPPKGQSATCDLCGLAFNSKILGKHQQLHHSLQNLDRSGMYVITIDLYNNITGHKHLFKCSICNVNLLKIKTIENHMREVEHGTVHVKCTKCDILIHRKSERMHYALHHDALNMSPEDFVILETVGNDKLRLLKLTDESDKKTELINDDSSNVSRICNNDVCTTKDDSLNVKLKSDNQEVSSQEIKTDELKKDRKEMLSKTYIGSLAKISVKEAAKKYIKILTNDKSIQSKKLYGSDILNSRKLFRCCYCGINYIAVKSLMSHYTRRELNDCKIVGVKCLICSLKFSKSILMSHVEIHHKKMGLTANQLKIHTVYQRTKQPSPEKTMGKTEDDPDMELQSTSIQICDNQDYTLYQCKKCTVNFLTLERLKKHLKYCEGKFSKTPLGRPLKCELCGKLFIKRSLDRHLVLHHNTVLNAHNVSYVPIDSESDNDVEEDVDDDGAPVKSRDCISDVSVNKTQVQLIKCGKCSLNFLTQHAFERHESRARACVPGRGGHRCEICGNLFTQISLTKHLKRDHNNANNLEGSSTTTIDEDLNFEDTRESEKEIVSSNMPFTAFEVEKNVDASITKDENIKTKHVRNSISSCPKNRLRLKNHFINTEAYYCINCSIGFIKFLALYKHSCKSKPVRKSKCIFCGLYYCDRPQHGPSNLSSLDKHIQLHHSENSADVINVLDVTGKVINIIRNTGEPVLGAETTAATTVRNTGQQNDETEPDEISSKITTLNFDLFSNKLWKCSDCDLHFLTAESWLWHTQNEKHTVKRVRCTSCSLCFTIKTLPTHVFVQHEKLKLQVEHFKIINKAEDDIVELDGDSEKKSCKLDKDQACPSKNEETSVLQLSANDTNNHDLTLSFDDHIIHKDDKMSPKSKEHNSGKKESQSSSPISSISSESKSSPNSDKIKLYKCAECNVCFLSQLVCYKHVTKHTPIDPKDYIECKLCGYQFLVMNSLPRHIVKHHTNPFKPESVLIEEYDPNILLHGAPKLNIYNGKDKVQSKLISTTCENNSELENTYCEDDTSNEKSNIGEVIVDSVLNSEITKTKPGLSDRLNTSSDVGKSSEKNIDSLPNIKVLETATTSGNTCKGIHENKNVDEETTSNSPDCILATNKMATLNKSLLDKKTEPIVTIDLEEIESSNKSLENITDSVSTKLLTSDTECERTNKIIDLEKVVSFENFTKSNNINKRVQVYCTHTEMLSDKISTTNKKSFMKRTSLVTEEGHSFPAVDIVEIDDDENNHVINRPIISENPVIVTHPENKSDSVANKDKIKDTFFKSTVDSSKINNEMLINEINVDLTNATIEIEDDD